MRDSIGLESAIGTEFTKTNRPTVPGNRPTAPNSRVTTAPAGGSEIFHCMLTSENSQIRIGSSIRPTWMRDTEQDSLIRLSLGDPQSFGQNR